MTSPDPGWLDTASNDDWPSKARRLGLVARAGLPVPRGLVLPPDPSRLDEPTTRAAVEQLLAQGPVVVRSALWGEDEAEGSAAGLGRSSLDCTDLARVQQALADLAAQRENPWLSAYRDDTSGPDAAIVQQQIARRALLVIAVPPGGPPEIEVHTAQGEALAAGRTPEYAGRLAGWEDLARPRVEALVEQVVAHLETPEHGHDLELVVDPSDEVFVVQARPLAAPLHPGWDEFRRAVDAGPTPPSLHGVLTLDAEHNPAPLSFAHAWLMDRLREQRPKAGDPTVLAGWLYVRTLPRDLARQSSRTHTTKTSDAPPPPTAVAVVEQLHRTILPEARAQLDTLRQAFSAMDPLALAEARDQAEQAFLAMIDAYIGVLVPARTRARRALASSPLAVDPSRPLSTLGRDEFLDVLPATWDLKSPSLAALGTTARETPAASTDDDLLPRDEATAAILLGEWDDHLFALGLAPLRAWFLAAASLLGCGADEVFMLTGDEVAQALRGETPVALESLITERTTAWNRQAALRPPLRIEDGQPVSFGRRARLRGIPLGPSHTGPLAPRADLAALLADPPAPEAIVTLPSLTAPAAVALEQLGVRAVCCEHGGPLSHAALMARELSLSALIGCRGCTELPAGRRARLDTTAGRLVLEPDGTRSTE